MYEYTFSYDVWVSLGCPEEILEYLVETDSEGNFILMIPSIEDNSGNGIPDFLDKMTGSGDIILNPSQGVAVG